MTSIRQALAWLALVSLAIFVGYLVLAQTGQLNLSREKLIEEYRSRDSRFAVIDGVEIHYLDTGRGPTLVLLHGDRTNARIWRPWIDRLSAHYRIIAPDIPGYGLSGPDPTGDYSVNRTVMLARDLVAKVAPGSYDVAGTSIGGIVAFHLAADDPSVRKLILINAAGLPRRPGESPNRPEINPFKAWLHKAYFPRQFFEDRVPKMLGNPAFATSALIDEFYDMTRRDGAMEERALRGAQYTSTGALNQLSRVRQPVLLLWSTGTPLGVKDADRFVAALSDTQVERHLIEGAGHLLAWERPNETAKLAQAFLAKGAR
jgi:pimeloyl-ACP methyl ester carboxylesterase